MFKFVLLIVVGVIIVVYVFLMGYDFLVLKYLEKLLFNCVVIIGSFLGYVFGNIIGISILLGGVVWYCIYVVVGLNVFDVVVLLGYILVVMGIGMMFVGFVVLGFFFDVISVVILFSFVMI